MASLPSPTQVNAPHHSFGSGRCYSKNDQLKSIQEYNSQLLIYNIAPVNIRHILVSRISNPMSRKTSFVEHLDIRKVAGSHYQIYEAYYQQMDPNNLGTIGALDAARFLKKSKLSDIVLGKIWDLSDPNQKGFLNKQGFFVALKLCALAQAGRGIAMDNILSSDVPYPKMGEIPKIQPNKVINSSQAKIDWSVKPTEKAKYDQLFDSLQPTNGLIPGNKVRNVLMDSKLPVEILGKIWDLADLDKDGSLNRHEFMIAMHLVYKALEKHTIPNELPPELMPPAKRKDSIVSQPNLIMSTPMPPLPPQPSIPPLPNIPPQPSRPPLPPQPSFTPQPPSQPLIITQQPTAIPQPSGPLVAPNWVVTVEEKAKADALFQQTDFDKDGFVSGFEIKDVFLQSGVPQSVLAHIWNLCDTNQTGKLNNEQFALAMWLINRKVKGIDPPVTLTPDMVPPSMRTKTEGQGNEVVTIPTYSNPELELIAADIRELIKEKNILEADIAQKEADIKVKNGEVTSLQSEVDTLAATLKQLENQKGEAQKRLNDLKAQKSSIELELSDLVLEVVQEQEVVDKLRHQAAEQEESLKSQESELNSKKQELENLKQEEARLEKLQEESKKMLDNLGQKLQDSQLQISQVKAKITQLEEVQRQMNDAIALCESAVATNDPSTVPDSSLSIGPDFRDPEITKLTTIAEEGKDNTFSNINGTSGFNDDAFPNDAFTNNNGGAFGDDDPFGSAFGASKNTTNDGFAVSFNAFDTTTNSAAKTDPFDPFGDGTRADAKTPIDMSDKDPFGCDPFANLHAPERPTNPPARPESPSPALPPKKSKQPPPRPAPPRPMQPNMRAAPVPPTPSPDSTSVSSSQDPFGNSGGFANFANFDSKCCHRSTFLIKSYPYPESSSSPGLVPLSSTSFRSVTRPLLSQLNKPEPKPSTGGLRPDSKSPAQIQSQSVSPVNVSTQNRYASFEFTEDPFKNYRYDDLFNIDPFEEENTDTNQNPSSGKVDFKFEEDDLAYETPIGGEKDTIDSKFPKIDAFDADFSFGNDPFASVSSKTDKINGNSVSLFSNSKQVFSDKNSNNLSSDPFFPQKEEVKSNKNFKSDDLFESKKLDKVEVTKALPNEELQLVWAAEESLRLENERLKQEAQEKADYEYALALSKKDNNKDKRTIRNLLRLGRNSPAT